MANQESPSQQTLAHVYAVDLGISLANETVDLLTYDDASNLLLVIKGSVVFAYDTNCTTPGEHDQLKWTYPLQEGPKVRAMRVSLDGGLLALQRSPVMLELVDLPSGHCAVHATEKGRCEILTFFFTDVPDAEMVLVTRGGVEQCTFSPRRQGLRLTNVRRFPLAWAIYSHETRMLLAGVGPLTVPYMQAWQFVSSGIVSLPPFTVAASAPTSSVLTLSAAAPTAPLVAVSGVEQMPPPTESVRLVKMYGRVYVAFINLSSHRLELHRFYTDTVVLQHSYELYSRAVELSVVDNLLVVHNTDSAVALLYDVASSGNAPISHPLPLALMPHGSAAVQASIRPSSSLAMSSWSYHPPNTILDHVKQSSYRLALDLAALAHSAPDPSRLAGCLLRRRGGGRLGGDTTPRSLLLGILRNALTASGMQERLPLSTLRLMFEDLMSAYADAAAAAAGRGSSPGTTIIPPQVLSPDDLGRSLFLPLFERDAVPAAYLAAALTELTGAAVRADVRLPAYLQGLGLQLMLKQGQYYQVAQFLHCQAEHVTDVAAEQLEAAQAAAGPLAADVPQLAASIRARDILMGVSSGIPDAAPFSDSAPTAGAPPASALQRHLRTMLSKGLVLRAVREARTFALHGAEGRVPAVEFLEAAGRTGCLTTFAAVYRAFKGELAETFPMFEDARSRLLAMAA